MAVMRKTVRARTQTVNGMANAANVLIITAVLKEKYFV
ncbi:hypothetical protein P22_3807 [Propionispora sp. 2/2-37]|nr:hypothetical protein P22_3807 [Propionispora sp. 2/2-37]